MDLPEGLAVEPHPPLSVHLIHAQATRGRKGEGKGWGGGGQRIFGFGLLYPSLWGQNRIVKIQFSSLFLLRKHKTGLESEKNELL